MLPRQTDKHKQQLVRPSSMQHCYKMQTGRAAGQDGDLMLVTHIPCLSCAADKFGQLVLAPEIPKQPVPSAARLGGTTTIKTVPTAVAASKTPSSKSKSVVSQPDGITVDIDTINLKHSIPHGFIGISIEWQGIEYYGSAGSAWANVLSVLGPEPVIRVGGASQDRLTEVSLCDRGSAKHCSRCSYCN